EVAKPNQEFSNTRVPPDAPAAPSQTLISPAQPSASSDPTAHPAARDTSPSPSQAIKRVTLRPEAPVNSAPAAVASSVHTGLVPPPRPAPHLTFHPTPLACRTRRPDHASSIPTTYTVFHALSTSASRLYVRTQLPVSSRRFLRMRHPHLPIECRVFSELLRNL